MLTCYRTRRRLGAWLDEALGETEARATVAHVQGCARCRDEAEGLRRLRAALRRTADIAGPADWTGFWPGIVRGVQDARGAGRTPARARWRPRLAFGGALAAAALAALVFLPGTREFEARVIVNSAEAGQPGATVMVYAPPERDLAVVWLFDGE